MTHASRTVSVAFSLAVLGCAFPAARAQQPAGAEPQNKQLTTRDGVDLHITYYPSQAGKKAAPVVILHDAKETRQTYAELAKALAAPEEGSSPFAVVTVDLRGHGESLTQTVGARTRELSAAKLRAADRAAMVTQDMEAVRRFLVTENDAGKLNLNALSVIGVGLGASVAVNWAAVDWATPPLPNIKQGQDIKTLVLVSPRWKEDGLPITRAVQHPGLRSQVAVMMLFGEADRRVTADVTRIERQLERGRVEPPAATDDALPSLAKVGADSELQGSQWLKQAGEKGVSLITRFLTQYSVTPNHAWSERRQFN